MCLNSNLRNLCVEIPHWPTPPLRGFRGRFLAVGNWVDGWMNGTPRIGPRSAEGKPSMLHTISRLTRWALLLEYLVRFLRFRWNHLSLKASCWLRAIEWNRKLFAVLDWCLHQRLPSCIKPPENLANPNWPSSSELSLRPFPAVSPSERRTTWTSLRRANPSYQKATLFPSGIKATAQANAGRSVASTSSRHV